MKHLLLPIIIACASALSTVPSVRANHPLDNPLFQNTLIWIGTPPAPNSMPTLPIIDFQPPLDPFTEQTSRGVFGWMQNFEFEAEVLGLNRPPAARSTPWQATVLAVYTGRLTLALPDGQELVLDGGQALLVDPNDSSNFERKSMSDLMKEDRYRGALLAAVKTAATQLTNPAAGSNNADLLRALTAVVQRVAEADPTAVETIVKTAVDGLTQGGAEDPGTLRAITTVVAAAVNGAGTDPNRLYVVAAEAAQANGAESFTSTLLAQPSTSNELSEVFGPNPWDAFVPIDVIIVSPSS